MFFLGGGILKNNFCVLASLDFLHLPCFVRTFTSAHVSDFYVEINQLSQQQYSGIFCVTCQVLVCFFFIII